MMNFCSNCGEKIQNKPNYCAACGHTLQPVPAKKKRKINREAISEGSSRERYAFFIGLLGPVIAVLISAAFLYLADIELFSFALWFVIPAGGIGFGSISTLFYFLWLVRNGIKPKWKHFVASLLLVFITLFALEYSDYRMAHVSDNNEINHRFNGSHISNYIDEDDNVLTFENYFIFKLKNSQASLFVSRGIRAGEFDSPTSYNVFQWIITALGFLIGGLCTGLLSSSGKTHCAKCKRGYIDERNIGVISAVTLDVITESLNDYLRSDNVSAFMEMVKGFDIYKQDDFMEIHESYRCNIGFCPNCSDGYMIMRYYQRNNDGDLNEIESQKIVVSVSHKFAYDALQELNAS